MARVVASIMQHLLLAGQCTWAYVHLSQELDQSGVGISGNQSSRLPSAGSRLQQLKVMGRMRAAISSLEGASKWSRDL